MKIYTAIFFYDIKKLTVKFPFRVIRNSFFFLFYAFLPIFAQVLSITGEESASSVSTISAVSDPLPQELRLKPIKTYPHDKTSFCQGLVFDTAPDGTRFFYESAGKYGHSAIKKAALADGKTLKKTGLKRRYFGEGAALFGGRIYQITWQEETCFVYDSETLRQLEQFRYEGEGWGLTENGSELVMSDGSDRIVFRNPKDFSPIREIRVFWTNRTTGEKEPIPLLNELEWIEGEIWANIYETTKIVRINPDTGEAIQILNFSRYIPKECAGDPERVLNGIAWDRTTRHIFITGKEWPVLYELAIENDPAGKVP